MAEFDEFDDEVDDAMLEQLDAIEAKSAQPKHDVSTDADDEFSDPAWDALLTELPGVSQHTHVLETNPNTTNIPARSSGLVQQSLWGNKSSQSTLSQSTDKLPSSQVQASQGHVSLAPQCGLGARSNKVWDNSTFVLQIKAPAMHKNSRDAQRIVDEHLRRYSPPPMKLTLDAEQAKTWIYPINKPLRAYQLNIVKKALFEYVKKLTLAMCLSRCQQD